MITKELARDKIDKLVKKWGAINLLESGIKRKDFSEEDTATKFIKPLLEALGWDSSNIDEVREQVSIDSVLLPDCVLYVNNQPHIVIEYKKLGFGRVVKKGNKKKILHEAIKLQAKYAVLTSFSETKIYKVKDELEIASFTAYGKSEYETKFEELWNFLSKESAMHIQD